MPEVRTVSTTIGDTGNGMPQLGARSRIQLVKPQRAQAHAEARSRRRSARRSQPIPGIEVSLGNRPIYVALLGPDPEVLEAEVLTPRRQGREGPAASPT